MGSGAPAKRLNHRVATWKIKYQRTIGYVSLATFLIVLYQLIRDLYASPYMFWKPEFPIFAVAVFAITFLALLGLAELDWHLIFREEIGISVSKDPTLFLQAYRDAMLLHHWGQDDPEAESALRDVYRAIGREQLFERALIMVRCRSISTDRSEVGRDSAVVPVAQPHAKRGMESGASAAANADPDLSKGEWCSDCGYWEDEHRDMYPPHPFRPTRDESLRAGP